jgi:hypothetical protein
VWEWFVRAKSRKIPISGTSEVAGRMGYSYFKASNRWMQSFGDFRDICGEADVSEETVTDWAPKLPSLI